MLSFRAYSILFFAGTHLEVIIKFVYRLLFFFSSRRRYTRWPRDWSSDVCSSDLDVQLVWDLDRSARADHTVLERAGHRDRLERRTGLVAEPNSLVEEGAQRRAGGIVGIRARPVGKIGRASCRERVWMRAVRASLI